jgi:hypothetical protein
MTERARSLRTLTVAALVATAASGCGGGVHGINIGVRRVGVDLAFQADKDAAAKKPPTVIYIDTPPPLPTPVLARNPQNQIVILQPPPIKPVVNKCPRAPEGTPVERLATSDFQGKPKVGTYGVRNNGKIALVGPLPLILPVPPESEERLQNLNTDIKNPLGLPVTGAYEYDIVTPSGANSVTDRLRYTPGTGIELVRRIYVQDGKTVDFNPLKPVKLIAITSGEGNSWTDATSDPVTGITMTTQGTVGGRVRVDLCGTVVEAYKVTSTERLVSLNPNQTFASFTRDGDPSASGGQPNSYYISPQYGGLFVQVETHTTTTIGAITVNIDNIATKKSLEPGPLK